MLRVSPTAPRTWPTPTWPDFGPTTLRNRWRQRRTLLHAAPAPGPVPDGPAARRCVAEHRHMPRRAADPLLGSQSGRAVAQHPRHGDQPRSPLVPVLAPLRVTPPVRTPHPHDTIRTRIRLAADALTRTGTGRRPRCGRPRTCHTRPPWPAGPAWTARPADRAHKPTAPWTAACRAASAAADPAAMQPAPSQPTPPVRRVGPR